MWTGVYKYFWTKLCIILLEGQWVFSMFNAHQSDEEKHTRKEGMLYFNW